MDYLKLSELSQDEFEAIFAEKGTLKMEKMDEYSPEEIFESLVSILQKIIIFGSKNKEVRDLATDIVKNCPSHMVWDEVVAIQKWVQDNIRYKGDGFNVEQFQLPTKTISDKSGDCDCSSLLTCCMMRSIGHHAGVALVNTKGVEDIDHAMGCVAFRKDVVLQWGVKGPDGNIQALTGKLSNKIPDEYKVPLKVIKGGSDGNFRWIMSEVTEKKTMGWVPPKVTYAVVVTPEVVAKLNVQKGSK